MKFLLLAAFAIALVGLGIPCIAVEAPVPTDSTCAQTAGWAGELDPAVPGVDFTKMDFPAAIAACTEALKQNPQSSADRFRLGRAEVGAHNAQGVDDMIAAANAGYLPAMAYLAARYHDGSLFPRDLTEAFLWATRGSAAGSDDATEELASLYRFGQGVPKDVDRAVDLLQPLVAKGIASAQNTLGDIYLCTCHYFDLKKAADLYRQAGAKGDFPVADRNLAGLLSERNSPIYDAEGALFYYQRAVAAGFPLAIRELGNAYAFPDGIVPQDAAQAEQLYQQLVDRGFPEGLTGIGNLYKYGLQRPADSARAADFYRRALAAGDLDAAAELGPMLIDGNGVPTDVPGGVAILESAASKGSLPALLSLGHLYADGRSVPADLAQAVRYYGYAAGLGSPAAMKQAGLLELSGGPGYAADPVEAAQWLTMAAQHGDAEAAAALAPLYREGKGVPKDPVQARTLLLQAAKFHNSDAEEQLGEIFESGEGVATDIPAAIGYYQAAADQGSLPARYRLGRLYLDGKAGPDSVSLGIPLLQAALDGHFTDAAIPLGEAYANGTGTAKDPAKALASYLQGCGLYVGEACIISAGLEIAAGDLEMARAVLDRAGKDPASADEAARLLATLPPA